MSDFLLQKSPHRHVAYHHPPGIWFSEELKRWMVTSPDLVRKAIDHEAFSVPNYDISQITDRLSIDLTHWNEVRKWLPLAVEGSRHRQLREVFARHISRNTKVAVNTLAAELECGKKTLVSLPANEVFCLYSLLIRPAMMTALLKLAGLELPLEWKIEHLPLLFDVRLPIRQRKNLNQLIGMIIERQDSNLELEERYLRIAVLTLSVNTLVGSVVLTIVEKVNASKNRKLSGLDWPGDLARTGLPVIEKVAVREATLGGQRIRPGQGLRLFIESAGVTPSGDFHFSDMFFSVGSHKCLGINFSKQVWTVFREFISSIDRPMRVSEYRERFGDYVFNFPEVIKVQFDE